MCRHLYQRLETGALTVSLKTQRRIWAKNIVQSAENLNSKGLNQLIFC